MSLRPMLVFVLVALTRSEKPFDITDIKVPETVEPGEEVEIECVYDAEFTALKWFKGKIEFFRYSPAETPSIKTFAALGIGKVDSVFCGPNACRLRLGGLTEEASEVYRCDAEREKPPFKFASKTANMTVKGTAEEWPKIFGLQEAYSEGEIIFVECFGQHGTHLRWYVNGEEYPASGTDHRNKSLILKAERHLFVGINAELTLQCVEFSSNNLIASKTIKTELKDARRKSVSPYNNARARCSRNLGNFMSIILNVTLIWKELIS